MKVKTQKNVYVCYVYCTNFEMDYVENLDQHQLPWTQVPTQNPHFAISSVLTGCWMTFKVPVTQYNRGVKKHESFQLT